jgi:hypothetical protein
VIDPPVTGAASESSTVAVKVEVTTIREAPSPDRSNALEKRLSIIRLTRSNRRRFDLIHIRAAATANECAEQRLRGEVAK